MVFFAFATAFDLVVLLFVDRQSEAAGRFELGCLAASVAFASLHVRGSLRHTAPPAE